MSSLRAKLASTAAVMALAGGGVIIPTTTASANPCLSVLGQPASIVLRTGQNIGLFYEGYDSCNHNVYAEVHFNTAATGWDWKSEIGITHSTNGDWFNSFGNGGMTFWDSPAVPIYTEPKSDRRYNAYMTLQKNGIVACQGSSSWNFSGYSAQPTTVTCNW